MRRMFYHSGDDPGLPYDYSKRKAQESNLSSKSTQRKDDEDLIIEDNTIYEIDRECYERLWRQRRKKL